MVRQKQHECAVAVHNNVSSSTAEFIARSRYLVHLDHTIYLVHKPETRKESNCSCEQKKHKDHDGCVSKVEQSARESSDSQLGHKVMDTVAKEIYGCKTTCQERSPPPVVVLST